MSSLDLHTPNIRNLECRCSVASQSVEDLNFQGELDTFQNNGNQIVYPDPSEAADIKTRVGDKRPDKVFGLNQTPTFDRLLTASNNRRHTPFIGSKLLYPFLVVEAKGADGGNATFPSIENQSAFPLRTCVQLQQQLQISSGISLEPLVWFIPYQGDIYGLSACIFKDGKTLVYDLWMGRATSRDGAMQLLDIIDLISIWARDVYKLQILDCLAGGHTNLRRLTPTATRSNTQTTEMASPRSSFIPATTPNSRPVGSGLVETRSVIDLTMDDQLIDHNMQGSIYDDGEVLTRMALHPRLSRIPLDRAEFASRSATIRHVNMVSLHFVHLDLPADPHRLATYLKQMSTIENGTEASIARHVLAIFLDQEGALTTTYHVLAMIRYDWLRTGPECSSKSNALLRAIFGFRTNIRRTDWQIVRELWCVSCSMKALDTLASIAGTDTITPIEDIRTISPLTESIRATLDSIRRLTEHKAMSAALNSTTLHLAFYQTGDGSQSCGWVANIDSARRLVQSLLSIVQSALSTVTGSDVIDEGHVLMEITPNVRPLTGLDHFLTQPVIDHEAVLLRKESDWQNPAPDWCLMVLDDATDAENTRALANILKKVLRRIEALFVVEGSGQLESSYRALSVEEYDSATDFFVKWHQELLTDQGK